MFPQSAHPHRSPPFCSRWTSLLYVRLHCAGWGCHNPFTVIAKDRTFFLFTNSICPSGVLLQENVCLLAGVFSTAFGIKVEPNQKFSGFFNRSQRTVRRICEVFYIVFSAIRRRYLIHSIFLNFQKYTSKFSVAHLFRDLQGVHSTCYKL